MGMATSNMPTDDGKDHRTHRVYEGKVTGPSDDNDRMDLDHGYDDTPTHRHIWTDSSCWLKDLSGKKVRITIEVLE